MRGIGYEFFVCDFNYAHNLTKSGTENPENLVNILGSTIQILFILSLSDMICLIFLFTFLLISEVGPLERRLVKTNFVSNHS